MRPGKWDASNNVICSRTVDLESLEIKNMMSREWVLLDTISENELSAEIPRVIRESLKTKKAGMDPL